MADPRRAGRRAGTLAVLFSTAALAMAFQGFADPAEALAGCGSLTTNPNGSKTCTNSIPDIGCPSATGAGNAVTGYVITNLPQTDVVLSHLLSLGTPCPNATVNESFEENATTQNPDMTFPNPPIGEKAARDIYTITCNTMPCAPGPLGTTTFAVTYSDAVITSANLTRGIGANDLVLTVNYTGAFAGGTGFDFRLNTNATIGGITAPGCTPQNSIPGLHGGICAFSTNPGSPFVFNLNSSAIYSDGQGGFINADGSDPVKAITGPTTPSIVNPLQPPSPGAIGFLTSSIKVDPKKPRGSVLLSIALLDPNFAANGSGLDLGDAFMFLLGGALPKSATAAAQVQVGSLANTHLAAGHTSQAVPFSLNGKGRKVLKKTGKLKVTVSGTLRNAAGSTPFTGALKFVAKKAKKK
jgi:hypothetical protein